MVESMDEGLEGFEGLSMFSEWTSCMNILAERRQKLNMLLLPISCCISYSPSYSMMNIPYRSIIQICSVLLGFGL